jgi:hypothetical protein
MDYKGFTINIMDDVDADNPRNWDNLGTMYMRHHKYNLGDREGLTSSEICTIANDPKRISLWVYMYEHGEVALSTQDTYPFNDKWDSSIVGCISVSKDKVRKDWRVKRISQKLLNRVYDCLKGEVETYSQFLNGDVFGYITEDSDGNHIDSCYGFYGYDYENNGLLDYAKGHIDWVVSQRMRVKLARLKSYIRNRVPINRRTFA